MTFDHTQSLGLRADGSAFATFDQSNQTINLETGSDQYIGRVNLTDRVGLVEYDGSLNEAGKQDWQVSQEIGQTRGSYYVQNAADTPEDHYAEGIIYGMKSAEQHSVESWVAEDGVQEYDTTSRMLALDASGDIIWKVTEGEQRTDNSNSYNWTSTFLSVNAGDVNLESRVLESGSDMISSQGNFLLNYSDDKTVGVSLLTADNARHLVEGSTSTAGGRSNYSELILINRTDDGLDTRVGSGSFVFDHTKTHGIRAEDGQTLEVLKDDISRRVSASTTHTVTEVNENGEVIYQRPISVSTDITHTEDLYLVAPGNDSGTWIASMSNVEGTAIFTTRQSDTTPQAEGLKARADIVDYVTYTNSEGKEQIALRTDGTHLSFAPGLLNNPDPGGPSSTRVSGVALHSLPLETYGHTGSKGTLSSGLGLLSFQRDGRAFVNIDSQLLWANGARHTVYGKAAQYEEGNLGTVIVHDLKNNGRFAREVIDYGLDDSGLVAISASGDNGEIVTRFGNGTFIINSGASENFGLSALGENGQVVINNPTERKIADATDQALEVDGSESSITRSAVITHTKDLYEVSSGSEPATWNAQMSDVEGVATFKGRTGPSYSWGTVEAKIFDYSPNGLKTFGGYYSYAPGLLGGGEPGETPSLALGEVVLHSRPYRAVGNSPSKVTFSQGLGVLGFERDSEGFKGITTASLWLDNAQHTVLGEAKTYNKERRDFSIEYNGHELTSSSSAMG